MDLLAAWLLFPLELAIVCLGGGLLLRRLVAPALPAALVVPTGLALVLVVARLATATSATARLALPVVLLLVVLGFALQRRFISPALAGAWPVAAAVGVFAVCGAPVALSGAPTLAGYTLLPDPAHQLSLADLLPRYGPEPAALTPAAADRPSSAEVSTAGYVESAYPLAPQAALGTLAPLGVVDLAWLYAPFLAFCVATAACSLYAFSAGWLRDRPTRALAAFLAAQPALVVAYVLQGSIKEIAALAMLSLLLALVAVSISERWPPRALAPIGVAAVAALGALGPAAGAYLVPLLAVLVVGWLRRRGRPTSRDAWALLGVAAVTLALAAPILISISTAYAVNVGTLTNAEDLGNLAEPLNPLQITGVWLSGDYRFPPEATELNAGLSVVVLALALIGVLWAGRRGLRAPLLLFAGSAGVTAVLLARGSAYADAKVLMLGSPAVMLVAVLGAAALRRRTRPGAALLGAVLVGGVLTSNALAYHDAQLAPYERYRELSSIDRRLSGRGPVLLTDVDEFGKYFLRRSGVHALPEVVPDFRGRASDRQQGRQRRRTELPVDPDELELRSVESVPFVVMRRSPVASRPPANFARVLSGRYYEVWARGSGPVARVTAHLPLGRDLLQAAGPADCSAVLGLARAATRTGGDLSYVERPILPILLTSRAGHPPAWPVGGGYPGALVPRGPGRVEARLDAPPGRYAVWVEGSFGRSVAVAVDGRTLGRVAREQGNPGQWFALGSVEVRTARPLVTVLREGGTPAPGDGGSEGGLRHIGPVALVPTRAADPAVRRLASGRAADLCGRALDWVEVTSAKMPGRSG